MQDARNLIRYGGMRPDRDWLQFDCALSLRPVRISAHARHAARARLVAEPLHPARRPPDVAQHRGRPRASAATSSYPDLFQPYGGFPDGVQVENGHITMPDLPGIGFEGKADLYREMQELSS